MTNNQDVDSVLDNSYQVPVSSFEIKHTNTSLFMLAAVGVNMYNKLFQPYFVNAFINDVEYKHEFTRPVFVLFKTSSFMDVGWRKIYELLQKNPYFLVDYDCGIQEGYNLSMFVFECNPEYTEDYYHFKRGRYSQFSEAYKNKFFKTIPDETGDHINSLAYGVIFKESWLRKYMADKIGISEKQVGELKEWWDIPSKEREYYRYSPEKEKQKFI